VPSGAPLDGLRATGPPPRLAWGFSAECGGSLSRLAAGTRAKDHPPLWPSPNIRGFLHERQVLPRDPPGSVGLLGGGRRRRARGPLPNIVPQAARICPAITAVARPHVDVVQRCLPRLAHGGHAFQRVLLKVGDSSRNCLICRKLQVNSSQGAVQTEVYDDRRVRGPNERLRARPVPSGASLDGLLSD
jgi:hypothetical protein